MKIAVFGLGYVGFTVLCCLASEGHQVVGIDINPDKVAGIRHGKPPITEPLVADMLAAGLAAGLIETAGSPEDVLDDCDMAIICVGTPGATDGSHDMRFIADVTRQIAEEVRQRPVPLTVVYRSTFRPGTMDELVRPIFTARHGEATDSLIELVYNPEFLREASAVQDYFHPSKIVIGTRDGVGSAKMDALYAGAEAPTFRVAYREAEITKFVDNTWHAVKVAFANEIGRVCLSLGIRPAHVHEMFVADTKLNISPSYTRPGGAFGGSCLPKDVRALQRIAEDCGAGTHLVDSLMRSNDTHKAMLFHRATAGLVSGARVLLVGLAFKAHTDDLRESPNVDLARMMLEAGYHLSIFDPAVNAARLVGANRSYIDAHIPQLRKLLVSREEAETGNFDRIVTTNATARGMRLPAERCLDIATLN